MWPGSVRRQHFTSRSHTRMVASLPPDNSNPPAARYTPETREIYTNLTAHTALGNIKALDSRHAFCASEMKEDQQSATCLRRDRER